MHRRDSLSGFIGLSMVLSLCATAPSLAQTFNGGSNGSLGAFAPIVNTAVTLPSDWDSQLHHGEHPGRCHRLVHAECREHPGDDARIGDVVIAGALNLNGVSGLSPNGTQPGPAIQSGGRGGPGGFAGGAERHERADQQCGFRGSGAWRWESWRRWIDRTRRNVWSAGDIRLAHSTLRRVWRWWNERQ